MLNRMKDEVYILIDPFEIEKDSEKPDFKRRLGVVTLALALVVTLVIWISWFEMIKYVIISKFLIIMLRMMIIFIFWLLIKCITP